MGAGTTKRADRSKRARIDKASVKEIEAALGREDIAAEELAGLREKLNTTTDACARIDELEPKAHEAEERLEQLGVVPRQHL
ncbi:MAG TPA: hypothetical protein VH678_18570 [Xanthobacteraceae bacterium]